jgi:hypothetical protein
MDIHYILHRARTANFASYDVFTNYDMQQQRRAASVVAAIVLRCRPPPAVEEATLAPAAAAGQTINSSAIALASFAMVTAEATDFATFTATSEAIVPARTAAAVTSEAAMMPFVPANAETKRSATTTTSSATAFAVSASVAKPEPTAFPVRPCSPAPAVLPRTTVRTGPLPGPGVTGPPGRQRRPSLPRRRLWLGRATLPLSVNVSALHERKSKDKERKSKHQCLLWPFLKLLHCLQLLP